MTNEFKVGDKVKRTDARGGSPQILMDKVYTVGSVKNTIGEFLYLVEVDSGLFAHRFELIPQSPEEKAIELLSALGYGLTPPKPKLSGKVYVYRSTDGREQLSATTKSGYDSSYWELISIVDWTEGQGLESSTEATEPDGSF